MKSPLIYVTAVIVIAIVTDAITGMYLFNFILEQGLTIPILLLILAGVCNGVMDSIAHHDSFSKKTDTSITPPFWSRDAYFNSKYELRSDGAILKDANGKFKRKKWFNLIPIPCFLLDGWHLSKSIMLWSISIAVAYAGFKGWDILVATLIIRSAFAAGFHFSYR